jgi:SSS family solute:Na+ symporter
MDLAIDMLVVVAYFILVFLAGYLISRKHRRDSAIDFLTGGHELNWFKTGLTLVAMSIDTGTMAYAGIGFVWGLAIQWNAVNLWFTAPLAAMFLIPIYWRTKIVTTPELLEKRFNVRCRAFFSVAMTTAIVVMLTTIVYLGALILNDLFNWPVFISAILVIAVAGFYVIMGGMKTVLSINIYQSGFLVVSLVAVAVVAVIKVGGIEGLAGLNLVNEAGKPLHTTLPSFDLGLTSEKWYPFPPGILWPMIAGSAWIACNFAMVQRLLAAKNEQHAQKAILFVGFWHVLLTLMGYVVGVCARVLLPDAEPDKSFIIMIMEMFPVGIRGLLIAGLFASMLSTIDGMLTSSGALITEDIFLRFIRPKARDRVIKTFTQIMMAAVIIVVIILIPIAAQHRTVMKFVQSFFGDVFGVIIALYLVGIFSKRATPGAAFISMVTAVTLAVFLDIATDLAFTYVGIFSFAYAVIAALVLSLFEKPLPEMKLRNLTVYTIDNIKGPLAGASSWPGLWQWILAMAVAWFGMTIIWEWMIR